MLIYIRLLTKINNMARRFRGRRRGSFRRARRFIRRTVATMGRIEPKRILLSQVGLTSRGAAVFDATKKIDLLVASETVNEETVSDGTNVAETKMYSRVVGMKFNFTLTPLASGEVIRWMLYKNVDSDITLNDLVDNNFHSSQDTTDLRQLRSVTLAKGVVYGTDRTSAKIKAFVRRSTLHRLGSLRENDKLTLVLATTSNATGCKIDGFGTIYVRTGN